MQRNWMVVYYQNGQGTQLDLYETEDKAKRAAKAVVEQEKSSTVYIGKNIFIMSRSVTETKVNND